jgi:hypothetical protein
MPPTMGARFAIGILAAAVLCGSPVRAEVHARIVNGALAQDPKSSVALCEGDTFYNCRVTCGGTLLGPNLVVTSRHCADIMQLDSLDCSTYRFSGALKSASTVWITAASPVSNDASFHQGLRWDIPRALGCGHDLAFLTLKDSVPADQAAPEAPATTHDAVSALASTPLTAYGYGRTAPDAAIDPERRRTTASVLCIGGRDSCKTVAGGRDLLEQEFAIDAQVCPGDSGSGVFSPAGLLLGPLGRTIGGSNVCAFGVYTRLAPHGLLLARTATTAAGLGAYATPDWVPALQRAGDSASLSPKAFGAPCDDGADCDSGECRSNDTGLTWSCAKPCAGGCAAACRHLPEGDFCFDEPATPTSSGCHVVAGSGSSTANDGRGYPAVALLFLAWTVVRRRITSAR